MNRAVLILAIAFGVTFVITLPAVFLMARFGILGSVIDLPIIFIGLMLAIYLLLLLIDKKVKRLPF